MPINQGPTVVTRTNEVTGTFTKNTTGVPVYSTASTNPVNITYSSTNHVYTGGSGNIYRGTSNHNVVQIGSNQPAIETRYLSNEKNRVQESISARGERQETISVRGERQVIGQTTTNQNVTQTIKYAEANLEEEAERPQYKKLYANDSQRVSSRTKTAVKDEAKCPIALLVFLGLIGLAGIVLGTLFGLGIIGGLKGPNIQSSETPTAPSTHPATNLPANDAGKPAI